MSDMRNIHIDILIAIAQYLETEDLYNAALTCRSWSDAIFKTPSLWQHPTLSIRLRGWGNLFDSACKPRSSALRAHLAKLPLLSLRIMRDACPVEGDLASTHRLNPFELARLVRRYYRHCVPPSHFIIENLKVAQVFFLLKDSRAVPQTDMISIRSDALFVELSSVHSLLSAIDNHASFDYPVVELHCGSPYLPSFRILSRSRLAGTSAGDPSPAVTHTFLCSVPDSLRKTWSCQGKLPLRLHQRQQVGVRGGHWNLNTSSQDVQSLLKLEMRQVWKLAYPYLPVVADNLVEVHLSFHAKTNTRHGDIARFMRLTMGASLEILEIQFPSRLVDGTDSLVINEAWMDGLVHAGNLREITLGHYIPRNIGLLGSSSGARKNLSKLVLADDNLPRDFVKSITPQYMPRLQILDTSRTSFHTRTPASELQIWEGLWKERKMKLFNPAEVLGWKHLTTSSERNED